LKKVRKALEKKLLEETDPEQVDLIIKKLRATDKAQQKKS
jgi:hypothetical protein